MTETFDFNNFEEKTTENGPYTMRSGKFRAYNEGIVPRGCVYQDDKFICRATNMPIEVGIVGAQEYYNLLYEDFILCRPTMDVVQILVYRLENNRREPEVYIATNQYMNAYCSKFSSPLLPQYSNVTHGSMFETILHRENYFEEYIEKMKREPFKTIDVWWIVTDERCDMPFSRGDQAKFAYRILPNGDLKYFDAIDAQNFTCIHGEKFSAVGNRTSLLGKVLTTQDFPMCATAFMIPKIVDEEGNEYTPAPANVNNVVVLNITNNTYDTIKKAVNNEPNLMNRVVLLMQYCLAKDQQKIDDIFNFAFQSTITNMFRKEAMTRELAELYLKTLMWYNPTYTWCAIYMFSKLVDHVEHEYVTWKCNGCKFVQGKTFWAKCLLNLSKMFKDRKSENYQTKVVLTRKDVENMILGKFTCFDITRYMLSEIKLLSDVDTAHSLLIKGWFVLCSVPIPLSQMITNKSWFNNKGSINQKLNYGDELNDVEKMFIDYCGQYINVTDCEMRQTSNNVETQNIIDDYDLYDEYTFPVLS
jgi:hypothetical protein